MAVGGEKYEKETDGFDGFGVQLRIIKSRTNQAGQIVPMLYDKVHGLDSIRSSVRYCKEMGLLSGNRNGYYINGDKDNKFTLMNMNEEFREKRELYKVLYNSIIPLLEKRLSVVSEEELVVPDEEFEY